MKMKLLHSRIDVGGGLGETTETQANLLRTATSNIVKQEIAGTSLRPDIAWIASIANSLSFHFQTSGG